MELFGQLGFDLAPRAHLHFELEQSGDRLRFIKTIDQSMEKWSTGTSNAGGAGGSWAKNLGSTTKPIVARAIEQKTVMVQNFQKAVNDGKWENNLLRIGDNGIKQAALAKADNYTTGTAANSPGATKMRNTLTKILQYEAAGLGAIYAMPKGTLAAGKARMNAWADYMAAGAGSFG